MVIYLTNVPEDMPASEIHELYRLRWQIELLFKTWKSDLEVDKMKKVKIERWLCHFYLQSIVLLLTEMIMGMMRNDLWATRKRRISERKTVRLIAKQINRLLKVCGIRKTAICLFRYAHPKRFVILPKV